MEQFKGRLVRAGIGCWSREASDARKLILLDFKNRVQLREGYAQLIDQGGCFLATQKPRFAIIVEYIGSFIDAEGDHVDRFRTKDTETGKTIWLMLGRKGPFSWERLPPSGVIPQSGKPISEPL